MNKELIVLNIEDLDEPEFITKHTNITPKRIKKIESLIRRSYEYKIYIYFLKNTLDLNRCAYISGYTIDTGAVEIHHEPFTLYDYTELICQKFLKEKGYFKTMEVAEEVTYLHYLFKVGLIPLNPTAHELVHNEEFEIHPDLLLGYWDEFFNEYKQYASNELILKYEKAISLQRKGNLNTVPLVLKRHELQLHIPDQISISNYDVSGMIKNVSLKRLEDFQSRKPEVDKIFIKE